MPSGDRRLQTNFTSPTNESIAIDPIITIPIIKPAEEPIIAPNVEIPNNFIDKFGLRQMTKNEDILIFVYYSFTTLSTVGFGDFHPKSNVERIFVAFFMLFGVMIFSYIMGNFIDMLNDI